MSSAEVITKALELSSEDRADLARQLILSLEPPAADADAENAWESEIERRLGRVDRGEARFFDVDESITRARRALGKENSQ